MQDGLNDTDIPVEPPHTATHHERLQHALAQRDRFLERNPRLRPLQAEIDRLLDKSGNNQGRMAVMGTLMQGKLLELQESLSKLSNILQEAVKTE
jgi:hypothetical protein